MIIERTPLVTASPFVFNTVALHCRVDGIDEFVVEISRMATAAALEFETYAQIALLDQLITVTLEDGPRLAWLDLPIAPLPEASTVTVTVDGIAFNDFAVITGRRPAIHFTAGKPCGLVVIQYQAGFGPTATAIPRDIENAICDQASALFDMRGTGDAKTNGMSPHMARVAARHRRVAL
jgi:uncharacterized phiE125 gp8 family phage protein